MSAGERSQSVPIDSYLTNGLGGENIARVFDAWDRPQWFETRTRLSTPPTCSAPLVRNLQRTNYGLPGAAVSGRGGGPLSKKKKRLPNRGVPGAPPARAQALLIYDRSRRAVPERLPLSLATRALVTTR